MISPFELARLLEKQRNLKNRKDALAPWYTAAIAWGIGIYWGKSHAPSVPPGGFAARLRGCRDAAAAWFSDVEITAPQKCFLRHAILTDAHRLIAILCAFGLFLAMKTIIRNRNAPNAVSRRFRCFVYMLWAVFAFNLGTIAAAPLQVQTMPEHADCAVAATIEDIQPGTAQAAVRIHRYACGGAEHIPPVPFKARMALNPDEAKNLRIGTEFSADGAFVRYKTPSVPGAFNTAQWAKNNDLSGFFKRSREKQKNAGARPRADAFEPPPFAALSVDRAPSVHFCAWLNAKRRAAYDVLQAHTGAGMLPALILGTTRAVDDQTRDDFGRLGIAHVLAVSGMHFGIIAFLIVAVLRRIISFFPYIMRRRGRRRLSLILMMPILTVYLLFVGAPLSAQRALIMLGACNLGQISGRKCDKMRAFLFAAFAMTAADPNVIFAVSFQLSFAAVLGIIWCTDFYAKFCKIRIRELPLPPKIANAAEAFVSALLITAATAMTTAPFVLFHFGQLPVVGTLANLIVIPWVSFVLMPAMIIAAFGLLIHAPSGEYVAGIARFLEDITAEFANISINHIPAACIDVIPDSALCFATAAVVCLIWIRPGRAKWRIALAVIPAICLAAVTAAMAVAPQKFSNPDGMRISFVAMGQADATLIEFPNGQNMLIDAGAELGRRSNATQTQLIPYLRRRGIKTVDVLVLTHWDYDHVAGLPHLLGRRGLKIGEIWHNGSDAPDSPYQKLAAQSGIPLKNVRTMPRLHAYGEPELRILWPPQQRPNAPSKQTPETFRNAAVGNRLSKIPPKTYLYASAASVPCRGFKRKNACADAPPAPQNENSPADQTEYPSDQDEYPTNQNDASIVLHLSWGHFSAMFMGDASQAVERRIIFDHPGLTSNATVLKAGHHGSKTSSSKTCVEHVNPRYAVFSVGENNRYRFPHFDVQSAFFAQNTRMLRTDADGTVQIATNGKRMRISTMY